ncbi:hypothetical protein GCM10027089_15410 [Nocardia thraciensis]
MVASIARQQWERAAEMVACDAAVLRRMHTLGEVNGWAVDHGLVGSMWGKVKSELVRQLDIDVDAMYATEFDRWSGEIQSAAMVSGR